MDKDQLENFYNEKKWSLKAIANHFGVAESTIHRLFVRYNIPRRKAKKPKKEIPTKEYLKQLYYGEGKVLREIAEMFEINTNLVSKWFKYYGLEVDYFKTRPSFEELENFYIKEKMNLNQLMKIFNVGRNTIRKWFKYYGIEIRSPQRKYAHLRKVPLTQIQKEFIVGTLLGDGYLGKYNALEIKHSYKQLKYLLHKKEFMSNYVNYIREHKTTLNVTEKEYICWSWHTIRLDELSFFRKLFYENNKKVVKRDIIKFLTPFAMAIWYMDDGWRSKSCMKISSESFTEKEHLLLKDMIKINFDINVKPCKYNRNGKEYNYLSFNKRNSILLTKLIKPYVIESMEYKLVPLEEEPFLND